MFLKTQKVLDNWALAPLKSYVVAEINCFCPNLKLCIICPLEFILLFLNKIFAKMFDLKNKTVFIECDLTSYFGNVAALVCAAV